MKRNHEPVPQAASEVILYQDSVPAEVFKTEGDIVNIGHLVRQAIVRPEDFDSGAIVVQTKPTRTGEPPRHYFLDHEWMVDPATGNCVRIDAFGGALDQHSITIGRNWHSPLGITYPVEWVMRPLRAVPDAEERRSKPHLRAPTVDGRMTIDRMTGQPVRIIEPLTE
ncbi:MAG TPA: hypothetical protein VGG13_03645 [Candidatus Saccharimonadales bacterium]|jgi:hypothetical protein